MSKAFFRLFSRLKGANQTRGDLGITIFKTTDKINLRVTQLNREKLLRIKEIDLCALYLNFY